MTIKKSKTILLLDIDYTIFDSDIYREYVYSALAKELGYKDFDEFYPLSKVVSARVKEKVKHYNPDLLLKELLLIKKTKTDLEKLEKIFWNDEIYIKSLYSETKSLLREIKAKDITIGILSTGHDRHQRQKIKNINDFFHNEHIHIFTNKIQKLGEIMDKYETDNLILVDDLPLVLAEAKKKNDDITAVLVRRNKKYETTTEVPGFVPDKVISSLNELKAIIN